MAQSPPMMTVHIRPDGRVTFIAPGHDPVTLSWSEAQALIGPVKSSDRSTTSENRRMN
jgi:hypothetical protein